MFLIFASFGTAQEGKTEQIQATYDQQKDVTTIVLNPFVLVSRRYEELRLGAMTSYKGKVKVRPKEVALILVSLSKSDVNRYESARKLTVIFDGESVSLGETQRSKQSQNGVFIESMLAVLPFDTLLKIANAKDVTIKLGLTSVKLSSEHLTKLRAAASYMTS
ncbi:MAG: hypothetical protein H0V88_15565 [Pyrinomonadaceae bacterium]|nr:hypothetical protein [Pyrinomonadaceae bacterium]